MARLLIVEDDEAMGIALKDGLETEGHAVTLARDGVRGLDLATATAYDLMVLDVMLPKLSGHDVCRRLREAGSRLPIIMLSARSQEVDKVVGLKIGADDYLTKPFSFMELVARIEAVLRRTHAPESSLPQRISFGDVVVDLRAGEVERRGEPVELSAREFRLLAYFIAHAGEVLDRDTLLDAVWDYDDAPLTRTVDVHVAKLRKKLETHPADPEHILTVHRMGYKFVVAR